jgi:hypothetical protein
MVRVVKKNVGPDPLRDVVARFPESGDRVRGLFQADEQFRELCADYSECMVALRRFRKQDAGRGERIEQYTELQVSLERELVGKIAGPAGR